MNTKLVTLAVAALSVPVLLASSAAHADEPAVTPAVTETPGGHAAPDGHASEGDATKTTPEKGDPSKAAKEAFFEHGRLGVGGAITEDMWKVGVLYEQQYFEAQIWAHAGPMGDVDRDIHTIFKVGARIPLGTLNYLALGGEFGPHPGSRENGVNTGGTFQIGPYISLERYFAATPVMMVLWVNPIQYEHVVESGPSDSDPNKFVPVSHNAMRAFQSGGFGLAYLF